MNTPPIVSRGTVRGIASIVVVAIAITLLVWDRDPAQTARSTATPTGAAHPQPPAPESEMSHTVVDQQGHAIQGARATWKLLNKDQSAWTDDRGQFHCASKPATIEYRAEGFVDQAESGDTKRVVLRRVQSFGGVVIDQNGDLIEGLPLDVELVPEGDFDEMQLKATSGRDGRFRLNGLPPGYVIVRADHLDWVRDEDGFRGFVGEENARVVIVADRTIRGRVTDSDGRPIEDAMIIDAADDYVESTGQSGGIANAGAIADSDATGAFEFRLPANEQHRVFAEFEGRRSAVVAIERTSASPAEPIELRVSDKVTHRSFVRLRVVDPKGRLVPDAVVRWSRLAYLPEGATRRPDGTAALPPMQTTIQNLLPTYFFSPEKQTDENGEVAFDLPLPPHTKMEFFITARNDLLPARVVCTSTVRNDAEFTVAHMKQGVRRRVRFLDGDRAVNILANFAGPCITISHTGDDPRIMLVDPTARYLVALDDMFNTAVLDRAWAPPVEDVITTFRVPPNFGSDDEHASIHSTLLVTDHRGQPLPFARCQFHYPGYGILDADDDRPHFTDRAGSTPILGEDNLLVAVSAPNHARVYIPIAQTKVQLQRAARLNVRLDLPNRFRPADWRLELQPHGWPVPYNLRCRLESARKIWWGIARWDSMYEQSYRWNIEQTMPTGSEGIIDNLPAGRCRVRLWTSNYEEIVYVDLRAGETAAAIFRGR